MSWIWPDHIRRDLPLTARQRKAILRDAWKLWWANGWNIGLFFSLVAFYFLTAFFATDAGGRLATFVGAGGLTYRLLRWATLVALLAMCFVLGQAVLQRYRFASCVYRATRQHGYDVCAKCGYWLRGLNDDIKRCPECGTQREPMPPGEAG